MRVLATIRDESGEVREISTVADVYDAGFRVLQGEVPDGWQMIAVGVEREESPDPTR